MKQIIVYIFYYIGVLASKLLDYNRLINITYPVYNYFMIKSLDLQDKWKLNKPWIKPNKEEYERIITETD